MSDPPVLEIIQNHFNNSQYSHKIIMNAIDNEKLLKANQAIADTKLIMTKNIQLTIDRGVRLDDIDDKSRKLQESALQFNQNSRKLKWKMILKNWKWLLAILFILALVILSGIPVAGGYLSLDICNLVT